MGNELYYRKEKPTVASGTSLKTKTNKIHQLKSNPKLPSKCKESNPSSLHIASSWVSTEVYYTATINDKPKRGELKSRGNAQKICN